MATLTLRNIDDAAKQALRERAAKRGSSMEREAAAVMRRGRDGMQARKRRATVEDILKLGIAPKEPFDLKKLTDEMWDEGLL